MGVAFFIQTYKTLSVLFLPRFIYRLQLSTKLTRNSKKQGDQAQKFTNKVFSFFPTIIQAHCPKCGDRKAALSIVCVCDVIQAARWHSTAKPRVFQLPFVFSICFVFSFYFQGFIVAIFFDEIMLFRKRVLPFKCVCLAAVLLIICNGYLVMWY